jgi:type I restriction enzyme M protein
MNENDSNEAKTRRDFIDKALRKAGWGPIVPFQTGAQYDHGSVEEYPTKTGPADYILFQEGKALACVEGKRVRIGPQNVLQQAKRYARGFQDATCSLGAFGEYHLPFVYSTNGKIIWFQDLRDPMNLSREVAAFHTPQALMEMLNKGEAAANWLAENEVDDKYLWPFQIKAIEGVEQASIDRRRHMLLAMATGTGKTFTIVNLIYRLMRSGYAKRVLFLVDRRALAAQAVMEMASFEAEPGLKFDKGYEVYSQKIQREDLDEDIKFDPKLLPPEYAWSVLKEKSGVDLTDHYMATLRGLGKQPNMLGDIYGGAMSRFSNPVNLKRLVNLIDEIEWTALKVDVKAAAYEGLLEKSASEGKKGAGQYFTPRILIQTIVRCMQPDPRKIKDFTIHDPAAGTGGFLVCAYEWLMKKAKGALKRADAKRILTSTYSGIELVPRPRRLALMNLYLHGIEANIYLGDAIYEPKKGGLYDCIMTNPPFGTKGANQAPARDDFTIATNNKQLNFVQHVMSILNPGGRAAIVVPDNVLFADQAGEVFKILTEDCDLHTVLRLPNGTFTPYSPGTKTNVIFFTKGYSTETVWVYDARTNVPRITKKDRPLTPQHFAEFESCYGRNPNGRGKRDPKKSKEDRWRSFHISEVKERDFKIDSLKWLKDESLDNSDELPEPEELATDAIAELEGAVEELNKIISMLENNSVVETQAASEASV